MHPRPDASLLISTFRHLRSECSTCTSHTQTPHGSTKPYAAWQNRPKTMPNALLLGPAIHRPACHGGQVYTCGRPGVSHEGKQGSRCWKGDMGFRRHQARNRVQASVSVCLPFPCPGWPAKTPSQIAPSTSAEHKPQDRRTHIVLVQVHHGACHISSCVQDGSIVEGVVLGEESSSIQSSAQAAPVAILQDQADLEELETRGWARADEYRAETSLARRWRSADANLQSGVCQQQSDTHECKTLFSSCYQYT